jgi:hypothetical protein
MKRVLFAATALAVLSNGTGWAKPHLCRINASRVRDHQGPLMAGARKKNKLNALMVHGMRHFTGLPATSTTAKDPKAMGNCCDLFDASPGSQEKLMAGRSRSRAAIGTFEKGRPNIPAHARLC